MPFLDVKLQNHEAFSCIPPPEDPRKKKRYEHSFDATLFMLFTYVNIYACEYISMNVLGLASCIPYALEHPRILGVSA